MIYDELLKELGDPMIGFVCEGATAVEEFTAWVAEEIGETDTESTT